MPRLRASSPCPTDFGEWSSGSLKRISSSSPKAAGAKRSRSRGRAKHRRQRALPSPVPPPISTLVRAPEGIGVKAHAHTIRGLARRELKPHAQHRLAAVGPARLWVLEVNPVGGRELFQILTIWPRVVSSCSSSTLRRLFRYPGLRLRKQPFHSGCPHVEHRCRRQAGDPRQLDADLQSVTGKLGDGVHAVGDPLDRGEV